jgi:hypothetical protein
MNLSKFIVIIFLSLNLFNCQGLTSRLWNINDYTDEFKYFLINQKYGFIVFITPKFHYVFSDNNNGIKNILNWQDRKILYIDTAKTRLKVDKNNNVSGEVFVKTFGEISSPARQNFLQKMGFVKQTEGWQKIVKIYGKRYIADPNLKGYLPQLDLNYKILVSMELAKGEIVTATALTPITITADGIISIGKILLKPFYD